MKWVNKYNDDDDDILPWWEYLVVYNKAIIFYTMSCRAEQKKLSWGKNAKGFLL